MLIIFLAEEKKQLTFSRTVIITGSGHSPDTGGKSSASDPSMTASRTYSRSQSSPHAASRLSFQRCLSPCILPKPFFLPPWFILTDFPPKAFLSLLLFCLECYSVPALNIWLLKPYPAFWTQFKCHLLLRRCLCPRPGTPLDTFQSLQAAPPWGASPHCILPPREM